MRHSSDAEHSMAILKNCRKGDLVIFYWSDEHQQYKILQNSPTLYFVHGESLNGLNLKIPPKEKSLEFFFGVVTHKETCLAKKVKYNLSML